MSTQTLVAKLRHQHPEWTLARIGKDAGVSRQRVYQLLNRAGLLTSTYLAHRPRTCRCGKKIFWRGGTSKGWLAGVCFHCRSLTTLVCEVCGVEFPILRSVARSRQKRGYTHTFCSRSCRGRYTGSHTGKYNLKSGANRKYSYAGVLELRVRGWTWTRIAALLEINPGALANHIYRMRQLYAY